MRNYRPVSVIIPTFNRAKYVTEAVDSVLAQTYLNYENIIVDDGSMDNTRAVLEKVYGKSIRYIFQKNKGASGARNRGIMESRYDLIAFLDSDDVWLPKKLELQVPLMSRGEVILSFTNWGVYGGAITDYFSHRKLDFPLTEFVVNYPLKMMVDSGGGRGILIQTCILKGEAVQKVGFFDERLKIADDARMLFRLSMEGIFAAHRCPLMKRRIEYGKEQITDPEDEKYNREHADEAVEILMETYIRGGKLSEDIQEELRKLLSYFLAKQGWYSAVKGKDSEARRKCLEALVYWLSGRTGVKSLVGIISLWLVRQYYVRRMREKNFST